MSLVVFPFKEEAVEVVAANLEVAASHERVDEVWAVAAAEGVMMAGVSKVAVAVESTHATPVRVFPQERIGRFRPGKGDGMNTAIAAAAERGFDRTHFYDADITNFDRSWIDGAEAAADNGFEVVRHRFPRAATDAMITWMVTRPGLARLFPGTVLPRLGQPLGGEILLSREVVESLASNDLVRARSDWGIDTVITYATSVMGRPIHEHHVADGKRHALYGSLTDIRDMVLECLDAVASLRERPGPTSGTGLDSDPTAPVPSDLKEAVAYDVEATRAAIAGAPTDPELAIMTGLGVDPEEEEIDEVHWGTILDGLLAAFDLDDSSWRNVAFRLWTQRVISYTTRHVPLGYDHAMVYLEDTIRRYEKDL